MLDAACPGEVFTSPVPDQMLAGRPQAVDGGAGVLHIVKNYTGDVLNFEMAAELAEDEGIEVASVLVNDDVAVQDTLYTAGRRGTGATLFVEKIAGALAEEGAPLAEVARGGAARSTSAAARFGVALTSCTTPAAGKPDLRPAGTARWSWASASTASPAGAGAPMTPGARAGRRRDGRRSTTTCRCADDLLVLVNGMGGTPLIELYVVYAEVAAIVRGKGGVGWPARWSATTSPAWTCRASRSRSAGSTTS